MWYQFSCSQDSGLVHLEELVLLTLSCSKFKQLVTHNIMSLQAGVGGGMKAGINIWRALRDITDVHPAWAHVAERRYTEADLPRPITRKEDVGTLTGTKEFDDAQVMRNTYDELLECNVCIHMTT